MADGIKIGSLDISAFKVGSSDCKVYLGSTLLYPQSQPPTPTLQWVSFSAGDAVPSGDVYGIKVSGATAFPSIISGSFFFINDSNDLNVYNGARYRWYYESNSCGTYENELGFRDDNWELMFNTVCGVDYYSVDTSKTTVIPYDCQLYIYA